MDEGPIVKPRDHLSNGRVSKNAIEAQGLHGRKLVKRL